MPNLCIKTISYSLLIACGCYAGISLADEDNVRFVGTLSGGVAFSSEINETDSVTFGEIDTETYRYRAEEDTETRGVFGGLLGVEMRVMRHLSWQSGVAYYQTTPFSARGDVTVNANNDPEFSPPYDYTYEVTTRQLLWENKVLWQWKKRYYPYLLVGIGAAFNSTSDFITHHPQEQPFVPTFDGRNTTSFTYSLGLGLDYAITQHMRLGLGYRFADLCKAGLGDGEYTTFFASTDVKALSPQSHIYTQEVMAQLTYLM